MRNIDELQEEIDELLVEIDRTREEVEALRKFNDELQDEVDSLWAMMAEITKSDIENYSHLLDELKADVITRTLKITKIKAEC